MKTNQVKHLNEFLSIPTGLELIADIDDIPLYTSDSLKEKFGNSLSKNKIAKNSYDLLSKLIDKERLIPCWTNKSFIGNVLIKLIGNSVNIMGLYIPKFNKIFVVMNGNINMFGVADDNRISDVTIHECCHMSAANSKVNFINIWEKELTIYYANFFRLLLDVKKEFEPQLSIIAKGFYTDIYNNFEHTVIADGDKFFRTWEKIIIKYTSKIPYDKTNLNREKLYGDIIHSLIDFGDLFTDGLETLSHYYQNYRHIWIPLFLAYKSLKMQIIPRTMPCQELFYPSEVIAILSSYSVIDQSKLKRSLSLIK